MALESAPRAGAAATPARSVPHIGGAPLSHQVIEAMVKAIRLGSFADGRLPAEVELADLLGVSRTTVRRALQSLEQLGLIDRRPGRGTRVRRYASPSLLALNGLVPFPTLLRELGHEVVTDVTSTEATGPSDDLARRLDRPVPGSYFERRVVVYADDVQAIVMEELYPADVLAAGYADEDLLADSILTLSERCFADKIDHGLVAFEPHTTGAPEALGLAMPPGKPCIVLDGVFFSSNSVGVAASRVAVNPKYLSFSVFRRFA